MLAQGIAPENWFSLVCVGNWVLSNFKPQLLQGIFSNLNKETMLARDNEISKKNIKKKLNNK